MSSSHRFPSKLLLKAAFAPIALIAISCGTVSPTKPPATSASAPAILSFTPTSGPVATSVTITGSNFTGASSVSFNGATATFSVVSSTQITTSVPSNATTGTISVTTSAGTATSSSNFTVSTPAPTISSFAPTSGPVGTTVILTGTNFSGTSAVSFNGTTATFTVNSATQITATVPTGAKTGSIVVTTPAGTASSATSFTVTVVTPAPAITSFTPTSGPIGTSVTVTGTNFTGATTVSFNGSSATFTVNSPTQITAAVPAAATTGKISVTTPGGTATSTSDFTVSTSAPIISSFTPASGQIGTSVTITGTSFTGATKVAFNGTSATYTVNSATQITTSVPTGAATGTISVTTPSGTATSSSSFTVSVATGLDLTIDGLYITQATQDYPTAIPLITSRNAWIRVFVKANQANTVAPQVGVQFTNGATTNSLTINAPGASVPTTIDPTVDASWDAAVNPAWIQPGTQIVATVDPAGLIAESNRANNQFTQTMNVSTLAQWRITLIPVQTGDGRVSTIVTPTKSALDWINLATRLHPVPNTVDVAVGTTMVSSVTTLLSDGSNWGTVLTELAAKHSTEDPHSNRYYYGIVSPNYNSGVVGLGYVGAPTAIGWDKDTSGTTLAHEEGHNMGDQHSPCGGAANPDPNYPYAGGVIGVAGWDVFATTGNLKPITDHDIMGYCNNIWISDYVYKNELNYRMNHDAITPAMDVAADATTPSTQEGLLVWGRIENGQMILEPAFRVPASSPTPRLGSYQWEARDAKGQALASFSFDAPEVADLPEGQSLRTFAFVAPMTAQALDNLQSFHIFKDGSELTHAVLSIQSAVATSNATPVRMQSMPNHAVQLSWDANAYPVLMIRDAQTGEIRGFARNGSALLQNMPDNLEIHYSNGIRSSSIHYQQPSE